MLKNLYFAVLMLVLPMHLVAAPEAERWSFWDHFNNTSRMEIDHSDWQNFLNLYVQEQTDGFNTVNYYAVTDADKQALKQYLKHLESTQIRHFRKAEQKAFWINLYNAQTINLILDHYPVASITDIDISPGFFSNGPWKKKLLVVEGQALSLDDIEHRILRPIWNDPRIHYAVNCASIGCPNLNTQAFTGSNSEQLLEESAQTFINHPRGVRIENGKLILSKIYSWFSEDFGKNEPNIIRHLQIYASDELKAKLKTIKEVDHYEYDWSLNEIKPDQS